MIKTNSTKTDKHKKLFFQRHNELKECHSQIILQLYSLQFV